MKTHIQVNALLATATITVIDDEGETVSIEVDANGLAIYPTVTVKNGDDETDIDLEGESPHSKPEFDSTEHALEWLFAPYSVPGEGETSHSVEPEFCGTDCNGGNPDWTVAINPIEFLLQHLEYCPEEDARMNDYTEGRGRLSSHPCASNWANMVDVADWIKIEYPDSASGPCAENPEHYWAGYSDAGEGSRLAYDFAWYQFYSDYESYVVIETHGRAVVFKENGCADMGWRNYNRVQVFCSEHDCTFNAEREGFDWHNPCDTSHPKWQPANVTVVDVEDTEDPERAAKIEHAKAQDMVSYWDGEHLSCPCPGCDGIVKGGAM